MTTTSIGRAALALPLLASLAGAEILCVAPEKANVREDAGLEHPVAWVADRHTPVAVLGRDGEWAKVQDVDGFGGWAHRSVLSETRCAVLAGKSANVRSGPGLEHRVLWEVDHGYPFEVLELRDGWVQVTDEDEVEGWVFARLLWGSLEPQGPGES